MNKTLFDLTHRDNSNTVIMIQRQHPQAVTENIINAKINLIRKLDSLNRMPVFMNLAITVDNIFLRLHDRIFTVLYAPIFNPYILFKEGKIFTKDTKRDLYKTDSELIVHPPTDAHPILYFCESTESLTFLTTYRSIVDPLYYYDKFNTAIIPVNSELSIECVRFLINNENDLKISESLLASSKYDKLNIEKYKNYFLEGEKFL